MAGAAAAVGGLAASNTSSAPSPTFPSASGSGRRESTGMITQKQQGGFGSRGEITLPGISTCTICWLSFSAQGLSGEALFKEFGFASAISSSLSFLPSSYFPEYFLKDATNSGTDSAVSNVCKQTPGAESLPPQPWAGRGHFPAQVPALGEASQPPWSPGKGQSLVPFAFCVFPLPAPQL